ncbi:MAG TPA: hypothetical protein ENG13_01800 [bacterium]|nr:hypothetical protein [bacterium]HEX67783.1 hypothetical protein [bacterium]
MGLIPLLSAIIAFFYWRKDKFIKFCFFSTIIFFLLALGKFTPLYRILFYIPGFKYFRVPARWITLASFTLSLASGWGLTLVLKEKENTRIEKIYRNLTYLAIFVVLASLLFLWTKPLLFPLFKKIIIRMYYG